MRIPTEFLQPNHLHSLFRGGSDTTGVDSHVVFSRGFAVKGYPELGANSLEVYKNLTSKAGSALDGEYGSVVGRSGQVWNVIVKVLPVLAVVESQDSDYRGYTVSLQARSISSRYGLDGKMMTSAINRMNGILVNSIPHDNAHIVDLNVKNAGDKTLLVTDIAANVKHLIREVGR